MADDRVASLAALLREILDSMLALIRELEAATVEWTAGTRSPIAESASHVARLIGKLGACHVEAGASRLGEPSPEAIEELAYKIPGLTIGVPDLSPPASRLREIAAAWLRAAYAVDFGVRAGSEETPQ